MVKLASASVAVGLLIMLCAGDAQPDPTPGTPQDEILSPASQPSYKVVRLGDTLLQAIALYQRSEFHKARRLLQEILGYVSQERTRLAQEAYTYLAFVHVAYGETEEAVSAFEKALSINPELPLPVDAPKIKQAFQQARLRYREKIRALDHDPPLLRHLPPEGGRYGRSLRVEAVAVDPSGVKRLVLHYRQAGNRGFSSVIMEQRTAGRFVATVPPFQVRRPAVEYYLAAWDTLGNGPGLKGSDRAPISIPVAGGPAAPKKPQEKPWYKSWWVWTAVAGAAAITGGIAAGVYYSRDKTSRSDFDFQKVDIK